ncbi:Leukocyte elastase inhibitor A [Collichthys lucidus]|uniref:Leukocyte elastase inhibitor A n=1 Tax=Collichthys lucidus TaxID=240159 RepID=A0A4U5UJI4_COLLU|nr:Leukocyte elastase inhibitor A [Collichthys lucidus]
MAAISNSNTDFACKLFHTLSHADPSGNIFVSPLSISSALAMVYLGAKGDTATQMAKAASYILKLANRLYGENTANFLPEFLDATQKYYHADLKAVDFIGAPDACRKEINTWVEQQTENKIKDLLKPGTVSTMTRLVLVNAIYFKGNWMDPFDPADTKEMSFETYKDGKKRVQMMYQIGEFPYKYIPEIGLQILELPYVGELSMFILLPEKTENGPDPLLMLEKKLTRANLEEWTKRGNMYNHKVHVHLPKFKLEENYKLNDPLAKLGMTYVFWSGKADLSGMKGDKTLFLSTVVHKAFVEVNKVGTEAAAATEESDDDMGFIDPVPQVAHFTADHPFLFFIRHDKTKSILFLGRFSSP